MSRKVRLLSAFLALSLLPLLGALLFAVSTYRELGEAGLGYIIAFVTLLACIVFIASYFLSSFFADNVRDLLAWLRKARASNFTEVPPIPVYGKDELGTLGTEMYNAVTYFKGVEEREKQVIQEKNEFITILAHQLRGPLTGLRWGIDSLMSDTSATSAAEIHAEINKYVDRMTGLIKTMLETADIEEGKYNYRFDKIDLHPVLNKVMSDFSAEAERKEVSLTLIADTSLKPVYADQNRIHIALTNLISNAIDYTPAGGHITVSAKNVSTGVELGVKDTGVGITPDDLKRLFGKFARGSQAARIHPDGFGLGLYITRNIVRKHGSDMHVQSEPGKGATFSFTLPFEKPDELNPDISLQTFFAGHD
jgi:signal transduction histidine kinase